MRNNQLKGNSIVIVIIIVILLLLIFNNQKYTINTTNIPNINRNKDNLTYTCVIKQLDTNNTLIYNNDISILPIPKHIYSNSSNINQYIVILSEFLTYYYNFNSTIDINRLISVSNRLCQRSKSSNSGSYHVIKNINIYINKQLLLQQLNHFSITNQSYTIHNNEEHLIIFSNSYNNYVSIYSTSLSGYIAAMSTLSQLISSGRTMIHLPTYIHDWPINRWRGLLIDVARHYIPIPLLYRVIDTMEISKYNRLHLHLTDSQSFPIILDDNIPLGLNVSNLARYGAHSSNKVYSKLDLNLLVKYAIERGIEIIPEIDLPAHTYSWSKGFPNLTIDCPIYANKQQTPSDIYTINPLNPLTMNVISEVIRQLIPIFTSKYFHIGGDEVHTKCWLESSDINSYINNITNNSLNTIENKSNRISNHLAKHKIMSDIFNTFENKVINIIKSYNKTPIVWQGLLDTNTLNNESNVIVEPWKCWNDLAIHASEKSYEYNLSVYLSACWYLDYETDWLTYLSTDTINDSIESIILKHKSSNLSFNEVHKNYFHGGEGAVWTEHIDHTNLECRIWPRAIAISTRLWGFQTKQLDYNKHRKLSNKIDFLSINQSKNLLLSFVRYRYYLYDIMNVNVADIIIHKQTTNSITKQLEIYPIIIRNESQAFELIKKSTFEIELNDKGPPSRYLRKGSISITSRCLGIPQEIQRPITTNRIQIAQLNIANGGELTTRGSIVIDWLQKKANQGFVLVGLCELNDWQNIHSTTSLSKNLPDIALKAANAGFAYYHAMANGQPYNIGVLSIFPFEIMNEFGPPDFQRGLLHIYIKKLDLHVMITHLHAHSSINREVEANRIIQISRQLLISDKKLIIMGDFNTLSLYDSHQHLDFYKMIVSNNNQIFQRFKKKFLTVNNTAINYEPMNIFMKNGFQDSCIYSCQQKLLLSTSQYSECKVNDLYLSINSTCKSFLTWTLNGLNLDELSKNMSNCMSINCPYTEPTYYNPEWNDNLMLGIKHPFIRLDYILLSSGFISNTANIHSFVDISNDTLYLSDHYPVVLSWENHDTNNSNTFSLY